MACKQCASDNQKVFGTEINVHFPGRRGLSMPVVMMFPQIVVCLDCGFAEFSVPQAELRRLEVGYGASA